MEKTEISVGMEELVALCMLCVGECLHIAIFNNAGDQRITTMKIQEKVQECINICWNRDRTKV